MSAAQKKTSKTASKIAPVRKAAFEILLKLAARDNHSDELLRSREVDALSAQDRALTTTLVLGTLRWQLNLDVRLHTLLSRPDATLAAPVETALRLGAFQLLYLDRIPPHAAIGESVEARQTIRRNLRCRHGQRRAPQAGADASPAHRARGRIIPSAVDGRTLGTFLWPRSRARHLCLRQRQQ